MLELVKSESTDDHPPPSPPRALSLFLSVLPLSLPEIALLKVSSHGGKLDS